MHAFIVGVGAYTHCGPATEHTLLRRLQDLPAARATALAMTDWLISTQSGDTDLPLASVELLVSGTAPTTYQGEPVERADRARFAASFDRWFRRCDNPDSVALFYFCGHGCVRDPAYEMLLLEDFAELPTSPFDQSVNFTALYDAMAYCPARTQCFFVDACREIPFELEAMTRLRGFEPAPLSADLAGRTTALRVHSTQYGQLAFAPPDGPTHFSAAVRFALDGGAAWPQPDGRWRVAADRLGPAVRRFPGGHPGAAPESDGPAEATPLRTLPGAPAVPFRLGCDPVEALGAAELSLQRVRGRAVACQRSPDPRPWHGTVPADFYDLHARFPEQEWHDGVRKGLFALPPFLDGQVEVSRR